MKDEYIWCMEEIWKKSQIDNDFEVSSFGNVRRSNGNVLPTWKVNRNYVQTQFKYNKKYSVHRLVAMEFVGNPFNYPCVNHLDGNGSNNHVENLEWCTHSQNTIHAYKIGKLSKKGEKHHMTPFKNEDIIEIRKRRANGEGVVRMAREYGVCHQTISNICNRISWLHV